MPGVVAATYDGIHACTAARIAITDPSAHADVLASILTAANALASPAVADTTVFSCPTNAGNCCASHTLAARHTRSWLVPVANSSLEAASADIRAIAELFIASPASGIFATSHVTTGIGTEFCTSSSAAGNFTAAHAAGGIVATCCAACADNRFSAYHATTDAFACFCTTSVAGGIRTVA
eukprot:6212888-Pleurochrysis_carterae.AAC.5